MVGTWFELERMFKEDGIEIGECMYPSLTRVELTNGVGVDIATSFYVGDAGGRTGDHNVSDRLYAMNVGIPFLTPEVRGPCF